MGEANTSTQGFILFECVEKGDIKVTHVSSKE